MSSTLLSSSFNSTVITSTTIPSEIVNDYDHQGAAIYIAVILIWYSTGLALMLFLQVRPRTFESQFLFDSSTINKLVSSTTNPFANYHNIQADNTKNHILNELKDPERRQRLWKIYYSSKEKQTEPHPQYYQTITADTVTIGHINRKLADIRRAKIRGEDDNLIPSSLSIPSNDNRVASGFDTTKFFTKRFTSLRRPNGGVPLNIRPPLIRVHSQPDASSAMNITETEPIGNGKNSLTNGSRRRNNKFLNRFTIEKVSENSTVKENVLK